MSDAEGTIAAMIDAYRTAVLACHRAAALVASHDLPELLAAIGRAQAVGDRGRALDEDREIVAAALPLYRLALKHGIGVASVVVRGCSGDRDGD